MHAFSWHKMGLLHHTVSHYVYNQTLNRLLNVLPTLPFEGDFDSRYLIQFGKDKLSPGV